MCWNHRVRAAINLLVAGGKGALAEFLRDVADTRTVRIGIRTNNAHHIRVICAATLCTDFDLEPASWSGTDPIEEVLREATQPRLATHQPRLLPFPDPGIQPPRMARRGEPVLPTRPLTGPEGLDDIAELKLLPALRALDGITSEELPEKLPAWNQPVTDVLAGRPWKFLVELDSEGRVRQLASLAGGQELSPRELSVWLRGATFRTKAREEGNRWVAVAIEFVNRKPTE